MGGDLSGHINGLFIAISVSLLIAQFFHVGQRDLMERLLSEVNSERDSVRNHPGLKGQWKTSYERFLRLGAGLSEEIVLFKAKRLTLGKEITLLFVCLCLAAATKDAHMVALYEQRGWIIPLTFWTATITTTAMLLIILWTGVRLLYIKFVLVDFSDRLILLQHDIRHLSGLKA